MHVVPVVVHGDVLLPHVVFVGQRGSIERNLRPGVISGAVKDVSGHVDHVSRGRRQRGEYLRAVQGLFRVRAGLNGVDPEMVRGGVFRFLFQNTLQDRQLFFLAFARLSAIVIAVADLPGECDAGIGILRILSHQGAQELDFRSDFALSSEPASRIAASRFGGLDVELLPLTRVAL